MKPDVPTRANFLICILLLAARQPFVCNAEVVVGPGPVPAPLAMYGGDFRVLAGTEIVSRSVEVFSNGQVLYGGSAAFTYGHGYFIVEGGLLEGATVTTQPGVISATGGNAVSTGNVGFPDLYFYDGVYRGGAVIIDAPAQAGGNFRGGAAFSARGDDVGVTMRIFGGLFEGGAVSTAASPGTPISRAHALDFSNNYGGTVDVYGGQFVGGIAIEVGNAAAPMHFRFNGAELDIQPPPVNGRVIASDITVSGRYADGVPFSHDIHLRNFYRTMYAYRGNDFLALAPYSVPEPSGLALAAMCCAIVARRQKTRRGS